MGFLGRIGETSRKERFVHEGNKMNAQERAKAYRVHISVKAPSGNELQGSGHFFKTEEEARGFADWISSLSTHKTLTGKLLLIGAALLACALAWILLIPYLLK